MGGGTGLSSRQSARAIGYSTGQKVPGIPVAKGNVVALTVPTWAPALVAGFGNDHSWRAASRKGGGCKDQATQSPQTEAGRIARYRCLFRTARLAYSATLVTAPVAAED